MNLQEENEFLRQQVRELKGGGLSWPIEWGLSKSETVILRLLAARQIVSLEAMMATLYGHRANPPNDNIIRQFIVNMREKLKPHGFEIMSRHGEGYEVPPYDREQLRNIAARYVVA